MNGMGAAGMASSSGQLVRQAMFINALSEARDGFASGSAQGAIDAFAQTRADIQTRNTYSTIAGGAMKWGPLRNVVLTVVRSEERRVGKEWGSTCRSRWSLYH